MGKLIEAAQSLGYHFTEGKPIRSVPMGDGFVEIKELRARSQDGQVMMIRTDDTPTIFPGGLSIRDGVSGTMDDIKTTFGAIYRDYYGLDDEAMAWLLSNYSLRTKRYLDGERARLGMTSAKEDVPEPFFALDHYEVVGPGHVEVDVGRYADGRFVAQTRPIVYIDDSHVLRIHFTRMPSREDVGDALTILKLERDFRLGRHREMFHCGKCGRLTHWLDIEGTVSEKLKRRLARDCGCGDDEK